MKPFSAVYRRSRRIVVRGSSDLLAVSGFVLVATLVLSAVDGTVVRAAFGIPLLLFVPGYVAVSVLFPRARPVPEGSTPLIAQTRDLSDAERVALAFGLSVALLPIFGLAISAAQLDYTSSTVVGTIGGVTLMGTILAIVRRLSLPAADRYHVAFGRRFDAALSSIFNTRSTAHTVLNVALIASMVLALSTVGYALVAPQDGETYTGVQLLTEDDSEELVAADYPETIEPGESVPLVIAVENQEATTQEYTVVVQEQRLDDGEVVDRTELDRVDYALADGETGYADRELTPTPEEGPVKLSVQVYVDDVPETPTGEEAYREAYIWTTVTE